MADTATEMRRLKSCSRSHFSLILFSIFFDHLFLKSLFNSSFFISRAMLMRKTWIFTIGAALIAALTVVGSIIIARSLTRPKTDVVTGDTEVKKEAKKADAHNDAEVAAIHKQKMDEYLGADDGYSFVIFYSGGIDGSLEPCG